MPRNLEQERGLLLDREEKIMQIEGDILDVNQIMRQLAIFVYQQGETISKRFCFISINISVFEISYNPFWLQIQ